MLVRLLVSLHMNTMYTELLALDRQMLLHLLPSQPNTGQHNVLARSVLQAHGVEGGDYNQLHCFRQGRTHVQIRCLVFVETAGTTNACTRATQV